MGGVSLGNWETGMVAREIAPARQMSMAMTAAKTGRPMKKCDMVLSPDLLSRDWTGFLLFREFGVVFYGEDFELHAGPQAGKAFDNDLFAF